MFENIRLSFQGIFSHKIRSFLTMLGIIIGIAAIIAIVSTIKGTNEEIKNNLIGSENNAVTVKLMQGDMDLSFDYQDPPAGVSVIKQTTLNKIKRVDDVENATLVRSRSYTDSVYYKSKQLESSYIYGIDENYFDTVGYKIKLGKGFSDVDMKGNRKVCIIDDVMASSFFGDVSPIGQILDIQKEPFTIIGVAVKSTTFEPVINNIEDYWTYNQELNPTIFLPTETWPIVFRYDEPQYVIAKAANTDSMTQVGKDVAEILNGTIYIKDKTSTTKIAYKSEDLLEQAKSLQDLKSSTNSMLIWIAGISLLVGGIGVMNIMLVSVTERTREIGLKKALGARKRTILSQFLTEASVLTSIGGIIGVLGGIGLSQIISKIAEVPVAISTPSIIVSVAFSVFVGVVFGLIPSIKAANLNPIDALRYE